MRGKPERQRGAVAVEFAICTLFILLPILAGLVDFAISLEFAHVASRAAREGAIQMSRHVKGSLGPTQVVEDYVESSDVYGAGSVTPSVSINGSDCGLADCSTLDCNPGDHVNIQVSLNIDGALVFKIFDFIPTQVSALAVAKCE